MHLVFVYGTLRRGQINHGLLEHSRFVGAGYIFGTVWAVAASWPGFYRDDECAVAGELYRVDEATLAELDHLEGYVRAGAAQNLYNRIVIAVDLDSGGTVDAWVYEYAEPYHLAQKRYQRWHDELDESDAVAEKNLLEAVAENELMAARKHSIRHRDEILQSELCGCYHCLKRFTPDLIGPDDWTDEDEHGVGQTVLCPRCGIDAVIGTASGFPVTRTFLAAMGLRSFGFGWNGMHYERVRDEDYPASL